MSDGIEARQHEESLETARELGKVWGELREHRAILVGPDGANGVRGQVKELYARTEAQGQAIADAREEFLDYWHNKRPEQCIGKAVLEAHLAEHAKRDEEEGNVKVAKVNTTGLVVGQLLTALAAILVPILLKVLG